MDEYLMPKNSRNSDETKKKMTKYAIKFLILVVITLALLITLKVSTSFKSLFYKNVYDTHLSFASINNYYQKIFGSPIFFKDFFEGKEQSVFNEKIKYRTVSKYYDGVALTVSKNLAVPVIETGMVVFVGEKENYGNVVIVQQIDGVDAWYGNLENINVKMYDYIEKGSVLANVKEETLYLVLKKDGESISYEAYL